MSTFGAIFFVRVCVFFLFLCFSVCVVIICFIFVFLLFVP